MKDDDAKSNPFLAMTQATFPNATSGSGLVEGPDQGYLNSIWVGSKSKLNEYLSQHSNTNTQTPSSLSYDIAHGALSNTSFFSSTNELRTQKEAFELRSKISNLVTELEAEKQNSESKEKKIQELTETLTLLRETDETINLYNQIRRDYCEDENIFNKIKQLFAKGKQCHAFVMSIDIRRSTELMLKARTPQLFEEFITGLCSQLKTIIIKNYGVFDKFTGDGVIAFFPSFYSGELSGPLAIDTALMCHAAFEKYYNENRHCFSTILLDIGLGIGIDSGECHLAAIGNYTLIGPAVVYACRLSSVDAGQTVLNQSAYEHILKHHRQYFRFSETNIPVKNEGRILGYRAESTGVSISKNPPEWTNESVPPEHDILNQE